LTTATLKPASSSSLATRRSWRPVASSSTSAIVCCLSVSTRLAMPSSVLSTPKVQFIGSRQTSSRALATSMPT